MSRGDKSLKSGARYCKIKRKGLTETNSTLDWKLTPTDQCASDVNNKNGRKKGLTIYLFT